jgi:hypothetical protein
VRVREEAWRILLFFAVALVTAIVLGRVTHWSDWTVASVGFCAGLAAEMVAVLVDRRNSRNNRDG